MRKKALSDLPVAIVWFRKDLRLADHPALSAAVADGHAIIPVFVLDDETPKEWSLGGASRWWLHQSLKAFSASLSKLRLEVVFRQGETVSVLSELVEETGATSIYFTRGYEPYQRPLEDRLQKAMTAVGVTCRRFSGHILFEPDKFANKAGEPFRVYTPFFKTAIARELPRSPLPTPTKLTPPASWPRSDALEDLNLEPRSPDWAGGFRATWTCGEAAGHARLTEFVNRALHAYADSRNTPGIDGTSRLSPHLAFGEISPNQVWHAVLTAAESSGKTGFGETYLKEIIWREFSYHLLFHFPHLPDKAFKREFDAFPWVKPESRIFQAWAKGRTGYPIVDAGMRQLWQTGWMHNRVRMITASFLIKHLLISWREGEAWFWDTLVDADLASNAASWQWVAGSGADAAPYFRIFNPVLQGEKFDPKGDYVRAFCPELARLPDAFLHKPWEADRRTLGMAGVELGSTYPAPIVVHADARKKALAAYEALRSN